MDICALCLDVPQLASKISVPGDLRKCLLSLGITADVSFFLNPLMVYPGYRVARPHEGLCRGLLACQMPLAVTGHPFNMVSALKFAQHLSNRFVPCWRGPRSLWASRRRTYSMTIQNKNIKSFKKIYELAIKKALLPISILNLNLFGPQTGSL